jgi:hypothetical protein
MLQTTSIASAGIANSPTSANAPQRSNGQHERFGAESALIRCAAAFVATFEEQIVRHDFDADALGTRFVIVGHHANLPALCILLDAHPMST